MENRKSSIGLSDTLAKSLSDKLNLIRNNLISNLSKNKLSSKLVSDFIDISEIVSYSLTSEKKLEIVTAFSLEEKVGLLLEDKNFDKIIVEDLKILSEEIQSLTKVLSLDYLSSLDDIEPELLKIVISKIINKLKEIEKIRAFDSSTVDTMITNAENTLENLNNNFVSNLVSTLNNMEQNSIKRMLEQSNKRLEELKKVQDGALQSFNDSIQDNIDNISIRIETEVGKFESRREDMDQLLEQVGLAKDAEVTISQANKEEKRADDFRKYGIGFLYASILVLVFMFSEYIGLNTLWGGAAKNLSDLTLEAFIIRFMTVTLISSPAIYMLKESASHRAKENLYRQRGTQLLTIRGYLSDLPDAQRTEVKKQLASNFFSFHNGKTDTSNVPDFIKNMNEAIKLAHAFRAPPIEKSEKESHPK